MNNKFDGDNWNKDGKKINSQENLLKVKKCLENDIIIIQHWYYRKGMAPNRLFIENFNDYIEYLAKDVSPGDILEIWPLNQVCNKESILVDGKFPDEEGRVPQKGAY